MFWAYWDQGFQEDPTAELLIRVFNLVALKLWILESSELGILRYALSRPNSQNCDLGLSWSYGFWRVLIWVWRSGFLRSRISIPKSLLRFPFDCSGDLNCRSMEEFWRISLKADPKSETCVIWLSIWLLWRYEFQKQIRILNWV